MEALSGYASPGAVLTDSDYDMEPEPASANFGGTASLPAAQPPGGQPRQPLAAPLTTAKQRQALAHACVARAAGKGGPVARKKAAGTVAKQQRASPAKPPRAQKRKAAGQVCQTLSRMQYPASATGSSSLQSMLTIKLLCLQCAVFSGCRRQVVMTALLQCPRSSHRMSRRQLCRLTQPPMALQLRSQTGPATSGSAAAAGPLKKSSRAPARRRPSSSGSSGRSSSGGPRSRRRTTSGSWNAKVNCCAMTVGLGILHRRVPRGVVLASQWPLASRASPTRQAVIAGESVLDTGDSSED